MEFERKTIKKTEKDSWHGGCSVPQRVTQHTHLLVHTPLFASAHCNESLVWYTSSAAPSVLGLQGTPPEYPVVVLCHRDLEALNL